MTLTLPAFSGLMAQPMAVRIKLVQIADRNDWDAAGMAGAIQHESGWNPRARNPGKSRATGFIQWTKDTAPLYGTTVDEIRNMPAVDQLDLAERYWRNASYGRGIGPRDFLVLGLGTGNVPGYYRPGLPDSTILYEPGSAGAEGNPGLQDESGAITVGTARAALNRTLSGVDEVSIVDELYDPETGELRPVVVKAAMGIEGLFWLGALAVFVVKVARKGKGKR